MTKQHQIIQIIIITIVLLAIGRFTANYLLSKRNNDLSNRSEHFEKIIKDVSQKLNESDEKLGKEEKEKDFQTELPTQNKIDEKEKN